MFSRAVVATDLGAASEAIVGCAGSLGSLGVREVFLVYAIDLEREPSAEQDAAFARQAESLESVGITVHVETPLGYAPHAIASLAEERDAQLIIMGTHGMGLFHTGFSGSVSSDVIRMSTVPVLLTPSSAMGTAEEGGKACARLLGSVLVPIDVTMTTEPICNIVCGLAPLGFGRFELLHVVPMDFETVRESREDRARDVLDGIAARARIAGVNEISVTVVRGEPEKLVPAYAASGRYTLLILAPGCHDTIDQVFGSVTNAVIRQAATPMLLAPPGCDIIPYRRGNT